MAYSRTSEFRHAFGAHSLTRWVRRLLIANVAIFVVNALVGLAGPNQLVNAFLWLDVSAVLTRPWTLLTYAFAHADIWHLLFNMIVLFFFGPPLEDRWGSRDFIKYYLVAALGGALLSFLTGGIVLGASGAVNGLILAYAMAWPDNEILFFGVFPIKAKYFAAGLAVISLFSAAGGTGDGVAHLAHLGGFVSGFLLLRSPWAPKPWGNVVMSNRPSAEGSFLQRMRERVTSRRERMRGEAQVRSMDRARAAERELLDDVDRILDKISEEGMESLTPEEKARLKDVSRQYRTN